MSIDRFIGNRLRRLREERAVDPEKVANVLSVSLQRYSAFELGRVRISARHLFDLSCFFDVPVTYFFEDYEISGGKDGSAKKPPTKNDNGSKASED